MYSIACWVHFLLDVFNKSTVVSWFVCTVLIHISMVTKSGSSSLTDQIWSSLGICTNGQFLLPLHTVGFTFSYPELEVNMLSFWNHWVFVVHCHHLTSDKNNNNNKIKTRPFSTRRNNNDFWRDPQQKIIQTPLIHLKAWLPCLKLFPYSVCHFIWGHLEHGKVLVLLKYDLPGLSFFAVMYLEVHFPDTSM